MSNPSKAKGTACETAIVRYLQTHGFPFADRQPLRGGRDQGDIAVCPGVIIEAKTSARTKATGLPADSVLADWLDQTELERANANADIGLLVVKRHGTTDPGRWHCWRNGGMDDSPIWGGWTMRPLADVVHLLRVIGYGDQLDEVAS